MLHVSSQTLRDWTDAGKIVAQVSDGGHRSYYEADVKRRALEEEGITTYWEAPITLAFDTDGNVSLWDEDANTIEEPVYYEHPLKRAWDFHNGLEERSHGVVLSGIHRTTPTTKFLEQSTSPDRSLLVIYGTIAALDKKTIESNYREFMKETIDWVKEAFKPLQVPVWSFRETGKLVSFQ